MNITARAIETVEHLPLPDAVLGAGIDYLCSLTNRKLRANLTPADQFAGSMKNFPIALHTNEANQQHYELPPEFFALILGPRRKYSCCYYDSAATSLADAENSALNYTARHAQLADDQEILELGCGWGSLSLWMAERFPRARITAVSNSSSQRAHIEQTASNRGLRNLSVITADMNDFTTTQKFDRVVSVEMFEHMANWRDLLTRVRSWLAPQGKLFIHIFTHATTPYRFDHLDKTDWIAQHFFAGGLMPSHNLLQEFPDLFRVERSWRWSGTHYQHTARDWRTNFDRNRPAIDRILTQVYGPAAPLWRRRWRLFFLATEGLFGHAKGANWGVSHYRLS